MRGCSCTGSGTPGSVAGTVARFEIDPGIKYRLMNGLDDIGLSLKRVDDIERYERDRERPGPVTTNL